MSFDEKEKLMFDHYKNVIVNAEFDEYDILGFLIFIRRHIESSTYKLINEFSHLVAHRGRDRGKVMSAIKGAIQNSYQSETGSRSVKGYHGMHFEEWKAEWITFGKEFDINFTDELILDITVCIFSLAQYTEYEDRSYKGKIELFQDNNCVLTLSTKESKNGSPYINFAKCGPLKFCKEYQAGHIQQPVETIRICKKLRLKDNKDFII